MSVEEIILSSKPESLDFPAVSLGHSGHVVYLATRGYTRLAADHLLHGEMVGGLESCVGDIIRQLNFIFNKVFCESTGDEVAGDEKKVLLCARTYDVLVQIALNVIGLERDIIGFSEAETNSAYFKIIESLKGLEHLEREKMHDEAPIAGAVLKTILSDMKKVMSGFYRPPGSMVSYMAKEVEKAIDWNNLMESFLNSAKRQIQDNIYYRFGRLGMCRFGNDYALGLRWLRHLGFVQVSTNPVLAASSFDDDPSLWEGYKGEDLCPDFKTAILENMDWLSNPSAYGEELSAAGTEVSIWPNLAIFRPIATASSMRHGMVSLQLNPLIADDYEKSLREAIKIYADAEDFLKKYDHYLLWGYSTYFERGRPNIVFKVAGSSPAAIELTRKLESLGIGTNNTVTFATSQEVELILAKVEGRAEAAKKGIHLTTVYETNMGGRLDDHIREVQAEEILRSVLEKLDRKEEALKELAESLNASKEVDTTASFEEKIRTLCSRRFLNPLNKESFIDFLAKHGVPYNSRDKVADHLTRLEEDIGYCGILVTKRVYEIFFSPENRPKWISYIQSKYSLKREQAEAALEGIDILPASKRKPKETLLTLGGTHMTHTEFPNHQMNILLKSLEAGFDVEDYRDSVLKDVDPETARRLLTGWKNTAKEFEKAYELTPKQVEILKEAGIANPYKHGSRGLKPTEWGSFGATAKTMDEFSRSYEKFKKKCIEFASKTIVQQ